MTEAFIHVRYSCPLCGIKDREVVVTARGDEDVITWMENTCVPTLGDDHHRLSPGCFPHTLRNISIPITGAGKVGGVVKQ